MQIKNLKKNNIIVTPNNIKNKILINLTGNELINSKYMSIKALTDSVFYTYDKKAIFHVMKKYNVKYEIAKIYLNNLIYIDDITVDSNKINILKEIKKDLEENNLLIKDDMFINYVKTNNNIIVIGYDYLTKLEQKTLNILREYADITIIDKEIKNYTHDVHSLPTMEDEVEYVAKSISKLLLDGIDINKIKLTNVGDDYFNTIEKIFKLYNIPININNKTNIFSTKIVSEFINNYQSDLSITMEYLKTITDLNNDKNLKIYNTLIKIINDYAWCEDKLEVKDLIINDIINTNIKDFEYKNAIEITDYKNNIFEDDEYIFMLGFNQNTIPKTYKDEEYITDDLKVNIPLETTNEKNKIEKNMVINNIKSIKNLTITYKQKTAFESFYPSSIIDELGMKVIEEENNVFESYSTLSNKINLTKKLDNLIKYGILDNTLPILYNNYQDIPYLTYNNNFTGIDKNLLKKYLDEKLKLSYSTMDNYYRCSFRYYLASILKLDIFEEKFTTFIGSLFHHILELALKRDIDIDEEINKYLVDNEKELNNKEKFFLEKLKKELEFIIKTIKKQSTYTSLENTLYEDKTYVYKDLEIPVVFSGITDKILYTEKDNKTIMAIIDYKTGNPDIDLRLSKYGIGMQLPIYMYLAKNNKKFNNPVFAGFYLQKILNNEITIDPNKTYEQQKENNLKLSGYSTTNKETLSMFDNTYESSLMITSMKTKNDGEFYHYSKVLSESEIDALINNVDEKINEAATNIINAKFDINPKRIGFSKNSNAGCDFCKFKDICFKTDKNYKYLEEPKDLSYLGGDE